MNRTKALFGTAIGLLAGAIALDLLMSRADTTSWGPEPVPQVPEPIPPPPLPTGASREFRIGDRIELEGVLSHENILRGHDRELFLRFSLDAKPGQKAERAPVAVAIVMDRSGSMAGDKIAKTREAAKAIVSRLSPRDRVTLVSYATDYSVDLPLTAVTDSNRAYVLGVIDEVLDGGGTNLSGGLEAGLGQLEGVAREGFIARVVLMSDGNANQGITDLPTLNRRARRARDAGVTISSLGIGVDFNEDLMSGIAESAGGAYYYAKNGTDVASALNREFESLAALAARQVEVSLTLAPGTRIAEVYGYETEVRDGRTVILVGDMRDGEQRQAVLRLMVSGTSSDEQAVSGVRLSYGTVDLGMQTFVAALSARVVSDASQLEDGVRNDVLEAAYAAMAASERTRAARAFESGDRSKAKVTLQKQLTDTRKAAARLGSQALMDQAERIESAIQNFEVYAPSSAAGRDLIKSEKLEAKKAQRY